MKEKYFNDAIIGNKEILASFNKNGELLRLYYPNKDNKQYIDFFNTGIKVNDSNIIYLSNDINNIYNQEYIEDTNILNTNIKNTYFNLKINQLDCISIDNNILIKKYTLKNENTINLDINFLIHSKILSSNNNQVSGYSIKNGIIQYSHDYVLSIISNNYDIETYQINDTKENIETGEIEDKDYIGMSSDSSINYKIGILKPGESKTIEILVIPKENDSKELLPQKDIEKYRKIDINKEISNTKSYWKKYIKNHDNLNLERVSLKYSKKVEQIYRRSILLFPLLTNQKTGGIIASVEIDEERKKSGSYAYCWPRDAVFITKALDILKMEKETEKFYKNFCKNTQSDTGMWEQRFFTDGNLAPCWGYQIDETASVIYGIYNHYKVTHDKKFLKDTLRMTEKATKFLKKYVEDILLETNKMHVSYDLWEMNEGIHLYSLSSIFAAFDSMINIYNELEEYFKENRVRQEKIRKEIEILRKYLVEIKKYILENLYDNNKKTFLRNTKDNKMDVSMIGAIVPFNVFSAKEKKVLNTIERINLTLRTYTGGYKRFEEDHYMGGNPWTITTLWMALYYLEEGKRSKAKECFEFVVKTACKNGLLPEQVNNETMEPAWVIGLGWAHAMFIIVLKNLIGD